MDWVKDKVPGCNNFTTDWNDGKKIGELVDTVAPGLCPDWEEFDPTKPLGKNIFKNYIKTQEQEIDYLNIDSRNQFLSKNCPTCEDGEQEVMEICNKCEDFDILRKPSLPTFKTPTGESEEDYLKQLCREGWRDILIDGGKVKDEDKKQKYLERFKSEFDVINDAIFVCANLVNFAKIFAK